VIISALAILSGGILAIASRGRLGHGGGAARQGRWSIVGAATVTLRRVGSDRLSGFPNSRSGGSLFGRRKNPWNGFDIFD
jgi:hypothetical protein